MAPAIDRTHYEQLKSQGISQREIAQRLGVARSTLQGWLKRQSLAPVQTPVHEPDTDAEHRVNTGAVQVFDTGAVQRLDALEQDVQRMHRVMQSLIDRLEHPPVQTPVQMTTLPPYPKAEAVRWNLWINRAIRDALATRAAARDISPSQLVQEYLWKALNDQT